MPFILPVSITCQHPPSPYALGKVPGIQRELRCCSCPGETSNHVPTCSHAFTPGLTPPPETIFLALGLANSSSISFYQITSFPREESFTSCFMPPLSFDPHVLEHLPLCIVIYLQVHVLKTGTVPYSSLSPQCLLLS